MIKQRFLFTSESVSEGHPDKVADIISDEIVSSHLACNPNAHVAAETLVTANTVILSGEVSDGGDIDYDKLVRAMISKIGYTDAKLGFSADTVTIINLIHKQSSDIAQGVNREQKELQGAGDQGMMFGYATAENDAMIPTPLLIAHTIVQVLADVRRMPSVMDYLCPDSKAQVSIVYETSEQYPEGKPLYISDIVISTQHMDFATDEAMRETIEHDIRKVVVPMVKMRLPDNIVALFNPETKYHVNPTGRFVIGGPMGDTGLTGRKIIVDTYGGKGAHGGGAFSGKDPSKVDRSAAYMARYIAKNIVAAGVAREVLVQLAYVIGESEPVSIYINTYGTARSGITDEMIGKCVAELFDLTPYGIIQYLGLKFLDYTKTASYGHFGRLPEMDCFTWEKLDMEDEVRAYFGIPAEE